MPQVRFMDGFDEGRALGAIDCADSMHSVPSGQRNVQTAPGADAVNCGPGTETGSCRNCSRSE